jgi:hypothetical protein
MLAKNLVFALAAVLSPLAMPAPARAFPTASQAEFLPVEKAAVKADYYYRGYYGYDRPRYESIEDTPLGILTLPGKILGTAFGAIAEGLSGDPYANPNFADPFYAPYAEDWDSYYGGGDQRYWESGRYWNSDRSYNYSRSYDYSGSHGYGASHGWRYYGRPYGYGETYYKNRHYDAPYYREAYYGDPYYGEPYRPRHSYREPYYDSAYGWTSYRDSFRGRVAYSDYGGTYSGGGIGACEREFRSFDPGTGTYINSYGERVFCPYLRP